MYAIFLDFTGKADQQDIVELGAELASDVTGRRSLLYPVLPTSTKHYIPSTLSSLSASAEIAREAGTSKKDPATRRKELLDYASPGLLEMIASKGEEMVRDAGAGLVVQEVMLHTIGGELSRH
jgi:pumilio family protein 6